MLEFSCHTWGFSDQLLPEALGTIARLGFRHVDIGSGTHINVVRASTPSTRVQAARELLEDLKAFNLSVADVSVMFPRISVNDAPKRDTDLKLFKALVPFLKGISARGVTVSAGLVHPPDDEEAYQRTINALGEMVTVCQKFEMAIRLEPHLDSMAQTPAQALRILNDVAGLGITLDWAQMVCQKIKLSDIITLMPHVKHVQIRQAAPQKLQTPHDKGKIDLHEVITTLKEANYAGMICIESLQTVNWHGAMPVNPIREASVLRDSLRDIRNALYT